MDHLVGRVTLHRIDDRDRLARSEAKAPRIAGLAAAGRIEHGAVEPDAALIRGDHPGGAAPGISIVAKNQDSHRRS